MQAGLSHRPSETITGETIVALGRPPKIIFTHDAAVNASGQEEIEFDGKYKPDENECLVIKSYDDIDNIHEAVGNPLAVPEISADMMPSSP